MVYITGDTHGQFDRVEHFCSKFKTTVDDILIINGDAGINTGWRRDIQKKEFLSELPITLLCVHGNHEMRPHHIPTYEQTEFCGGMVWREPKYPNINFAIDGEVFMLHGLKTLVIGGAYSVDKYYRLQADYPWWPDEQPSPEIKRRVESRIGAEHGLFDIILSHTCPYRYIPRDVFISGIDQSTVDSSTEKWLDCIYDLASFKVWCSSHFHVNRYSDKIVFLYDDICELRADLGK